MPVKPKIYDDSIFTKDTTVKKPAEKVYDDSAFTGEPVKKKEVGGQESKPYPRSIFQYQSPVEEVPETQVRLTDDEVYNLVKERQQLKYATSPDNKEYKAFYSYGDTQMAEQDRAKLEENTKKLKAAGLDADEVEGIFGDIPMLKTFGVAEALTVKRDNPEFFERRKAAIKYRSELYNAVKNEFGESAAKIYINDLAEEQKSHDYGEVRDGTRHLISEIYTRFDDGDKQKKLINEIVKDRMYTYGLNLPGTQEAIANDPRLGTLTEDQVLALQFLEDVDQQTAMSFNRLLSLTPEEIQKASKNNTSFKLGLQLKQKELEDIGLNIQQRAVEEKMKTLMTKKEKEGLTEEETAEGNRLYSVRKDLLEKRDNQNANYPLAVATDADRLMQDFLGARHGTLSKTFLGIGENADDLLNFATSATTFQAAKDGRIDDLEKFGSKQLGQLSQYDTKEEELFGRAFMPIASGPLKEKLDVIKNDKSLSREQQEDAARAAIFEDNFKNISYIANDKSGKFNFTGKAVLNAVSNVASEIIPQIVASYLTAGGSNAAKIQQLGSLFGNTFAMAYNDYYTDAINKNIAKPNDYAILHTVIEAGTELFGNNLEMAKKLFAGTTAGKLLSEATESEINAIAKAGKGKFKNFVDAAVRTGKISEKNTRIESFEEFSGAIGGNVIDKYAFNQDVAATDNALKDFVTTYVGLLPMGILGLPFQYKNVNQIQKRAFYEASSNPVKYFEKLDQQVEEGVMNINDAFQIKQRITDGYEALKELNVTKSDGNLMTDNEKTDYLFNKVIQKDIEKHKKEATEDQEAQLDEINAEISKNNEVLSTPVQKQKAVEELHTQKDAELKDIDDKLAALDTKSETYTSTKTELEKKREDVIVEYDSKLRAEREVSPKAAETVNEGGPKGEATPIEKTVKSTYESVSPILQRINNADYINENELDSAANNLYDVLDQIEKSDYTKEAKESSVNLIEPLISKIEGYEFRTKTESSTVTEAKTASVPRKTQREIKPALEQSTGSAATIRLPDGGTRKGTLNIRSGRYVLDIPQEEQIVIGEKAITDRDLQLPSVEEMENPIEFDESGAVKSVTFKTKSGSLITVEDPEKALDIAIQLRADAVGEVPQELFDTVYEEIQKEIQREVLVAKENPVESKKIQPEIEKKSAKKEELKKEQPKKEKTISQKGKELADKIRSLKTPRNISQANIFGIAVGIYDGALETIATAIENGAALIDAINEGIKYVRDNGGTELDETGFRKHIEDSVAGEKPRVKVQLTPEEKDQPDEYRDKAIIGRMMKSDKVSEESKKQLEGPGLKYKVKHQEEARKLANEVVDEYGVNAALVMAEAGKFHGDVNSMIFAVSLDRTFQEEQEATDPEDKQDAAERWADIALRYQDAAESGGRFISAINDFYKKSPAGLVIKVEKEFQRRQDEYFEGREKPTKEAWEEFINTVEGKELLEEEIEKRKPKLFTENTKKKIKNFFNKFRIDPKDTTGVYLVPPAIFNAAIDIIEQAVLAGVSIGKAIEQGVDYISSNHKEAWKVNEFRKDIKAGFKAQKVEKNLTDDDKKKILEKWRKKVRGLTEEQKQELLKKSFLQLIDNGALDYDDFKKLYADVVGLPQMTPELSAKLVDLANKMNEPDKLKEEILKTKSKPLIDKYKTAVHNAEKAATELNELIGKEKWWFNTAVSIMRLNTLGVTSLIGNIVGNAFNLPFRFMVNLTGTGIDYLLAGAQLASDKAFGTKLYKSKPIPSLFTTQRSFARGFKLGTQHAIDSFITGMTNKDYFQKEVKQNLRPLESAKRLWRGLTGKEKLSLNEAINAALEAFPLGGMSAEVIARTLNIGDKGFRFAAEYMAAEKIAQQKGLTGIDKEIFTLFPDEESEKKIREAGEAIVFQQKNAVTTMFDRMSAAGTSIFDDRPKWQKTAFQVLKGSGYTFQPFLNTPLNVSWEFFHYVFPPLPLIKAAIAMKNGSREQVAHHLAQAVIGTSFAVAATQLVLNGLIVASGGDEEKKKERSGVGVYQREDQLNLSGLKRWLAGGTAEVQDDDTWVDLKYYGIAGMLLLAKAKQYRTTTKKDIEKENILENLVYQFPAAWKMGLTEGVFGGTSSVINAFSMGGGYTDNLLLGMANVAENTLDPQWLRQFSLASNEYIRDTKGMTLSESAWLNLKNRLFAGGELPTKVNIWGDKIENVPSNQNPYLYHVFGLSKKNPFDNDRFGYALYDYYQQTKDYNIFPPSIMRKLNGVEMTPKQYEQFSILVGSHRKQLVAPLFEGNTFKELQAAGHEQVVKYFQSLYKKGRELAIFEFLNLYPEFQKGGVTEATPDD